MIQGPGGGKLPRLRHEPDRLCLKARETEVVAKTSEAFVVCQSGVASGYAPAMYFLAYMYGQGVGTERDWIRSGTYCIRRRSWDTCGSAMRPICTFRNSDRVAVAFRKEPRKLLATATSG